MPVTLLKDDSGETVRVLDVDGYYLPTFDLVLQNQEEEFRSIPEWKGRPDDVLICAYPKSGTHWLWEVTSMLLQGRADRVNLIKETSMLEGISQEIYNNIPSPRVLNTHITFDLLPRDVLKQKSKIIYILRNPKDVAVSFYNHHFKILEYSYSGKWESYIHRFIKGDVDYGSWFDYVLSWEKLIKDNPDIPIHIIHYEAMKKNNIEEIRRLSEFLGVKTDPELIEAIAEKCDFSSMKKEKDGMENPAEWRNGQAGMYRKGHIGDWKNWFTVAQNEHFDKIYAEKMAGSSLKFTYS